MESKAESKDDRAVVLGAEDLSKGAKSLRHTGIPEHHAPYCTIYKEHVEEKASAQELEPYERLFRQHKGDLRAMFDELGEDPGKALKYPPSNAEEFARVYTRGGYTYVPDAKSSTRK
ncbi:unnamed protein product [Ectocarpus sp. 12 AP-2014]